MPVLSSPLETLYRILVDHIGGADAKETETSLATEQNRIRIPQWCSQQVIHHTELDMEVSVVGKLVFNRYFQCKRKFGVQENGCDMDVCVTVCHSSGFLKHCPYIYVLQTPMNHPV
jgi:hypothetical protein